MPSSTFSCLIRAARVVTRARRLTAALVLLASIAPAAAQETARDAESALKVSQAAIGQPIGDYTFTGIDGRNIRLADFRGRPVALSFIYTACADTCPTITDTLADAAASAWEALGTNSFKVVTVGFNVPADSPEAMRKFAGRRGFKHQDWVWLSGELPEIAGLARDTGFVFFESAKGFDHIAQVTLIDPDGVVRGQIYGENFDLPKLVAPIKAMLIGAPFDSGVSIADRVRFFCTVYDARSGKYRVDYSFYVEIFAGVTVLVPAAWFLVSQRRRRPRR